MCTWLCRWRDAVWRCSFHMHVDDLLCHRAEIWIFLCMLFTPSIFATISNLQSDPSNTNCSSLYCSVLIQTLYITKWKLYFPRLVNIWLLPLSATFSLCAMSTVHAGKLAQMVHLGYIWIWFSIFLSRLCFFPFPLFILCFHLWAISIPLKAARDQRSWMDLAYKGKNLKEPLQ